MLQTMIKLGINGFIKKPFSNDQFSQVFTKWLQNSSFRNSQRVHERVIPLPADNVFLNISTEFHNRVVPCEVRDISAGGLAVELPRSFIRFASSSLKSGRIFNNTLLRIRQAAIRVDVEVIGIFGQKLTLRFINTKEDTMKYIYHYLADSFGV
jgi:hypothetical protein